MTGPTINGVGLHGTEWFSAREASSSDGTQPVAPATQSSASQTAATGTANLPQQLSRELHAYLLQMQTGASSPAQVPRGAGARPPPRSGAASDGGAPAARPAESGRSKPSGPALYLDAGSPTPAGNAGAASSRQAVEAPNGTTWTDSSTYPAALQAYVHSPPPRAVLLLKMA